MPLTWPSDPHLCRWMLFVDGENLAIRAKEFARAKALTLRPGPHYQEDVFVWFPSLDARPNLFSNAPLRLQTAAIRAHYYTSVAGDDARIEGVKAALWEIGFQPEVFKKDGRGRSKAVDISLAKDFLSNGFYDNYDAAVLIAGDGDYVPMVKEAKRMGKVVYVAFLRDYGLKDSLRLASDEFFSLNDYFISRWQPPINPASTS